VPTHVDTKHAGVGPHPHRGFSPVSFIFKGGVHHRDSRGNNNIVYAGGTQWMNAGMGVIHSERPPADIHEIGGRQELIQLWVNTPAKHKMDVPDYQPLTAEETPVVNSADQLTTVNVIAGELNGVKGPDQNIISRKHIHCNDEERRKILFRNSINTQCFHLYHGW
jgi:redox-sensitive bicupin YhaK (pirin superfamily)